MAGRYKAYPEYKDSGVEWFDRVPKQWGLLRHKYVSNFYKGKNPSTLLDSQKENTFRYLSMDYLRGGAEAKYAQIEAGSYVTDEGQILIIWDGSNAGEFVRGSSGILSSTMAAAELIYGILPQFYWYVCACLEPDMRKHANGMGIPHVNGNELRNSFLPIPLSCEQKQIAKFLDHETAKIDLLIAKQQALIALLKEKRQAVISHAVTKGLNPEARMKDSGVEWLGEVPEHWKHSYLGFECSVKARLGWKGLKAEEYVDEGYVFLATPNIKGEAIDFTNVDRITKERYDESPEIMLNEGDVLVTKDGSTTGTTNVVKELPEPATVNSSIAVLRSFGQLDSLYLYYFFTSDFTQNVITRMRGGMGVPHLFQADLKKFDVLVPPLIEQRKIAKHVEFEASVIDVLLRKAESAIELMQERRTALISAAVTGKIDVRSWTAPEEPVQKEEV